MADILARTRLLIGTTADWAAHDLVLGDGELVVERASPYYKLKVGDGASAYSALPFVSADPIVPLEYLTEAEGDARYLQLVDAESVIVSSGPADSGKLVRLAADGKIDPSMVTIITGGYRGTTDFTAPPPPGPNLAGDFWKNTTTGTVDAAWGLTPGTTSVIGEEMIFDGSAWELIDTGGAYLPITGGTLTGPLDVNASITGDLVESTLAVIARGALSTIAGAKAAIDYAAATARLVSVGDAVGTPGAFAFYQASSDNSVNRTALTIDAAGNVGIGVEPGAGAKLDALLDATNRFRLTGSAGRTYLDSLNAAASAFLPLTARGTEIQFNTAAAGAPATRLLIDGAGHVMPGGNGTQNFGAAALRWNTGFFREVSEGPTTMMLDSIGTTLRLGAGAGWTSVAIPTATCNLFASGSLRVGGHPTRVETLEQTCPSAAISITVSHTGSRAPDVMVAVLRCKIAEHGWNANEIVGLKNDIGDPNREFALGASASNFIFRWQGAGAPGVRNPTNGNYGVVTPANWRVVFIGFWL